MKKYFALLSLVILLFACASPVEMNCDKVFEILTETDGTIAGIMLGDSWSEVERMMKSKHETMVTDYNDGFLATLTMDYGLDQRRFVISCDLKNDIIQSIDIEIVDLPENKTKLVALHDRLVTHFMSEYPDEFVLNVSEYGDYGQWMVSDGEEYLTIAEPTLIGRAAGATKCINVSIGLTRRM